MTTPRVHRPEGTDGGDELIVEDGGTITVKDGGTITVKDGGVIEVESGGTFDMDDGTVVVTEPDDTTIEVDSVSGKLQVIDESIDEDKLAATVAGDGLTGGAGEPLAIDTQDPIADIDLTASDEYDETELQAVADKVDAILAALRLVKVIGTGD